MQRKIKTLFNELNARAQNKIARTRTKILDISQGFLIPSEHLLEKYSARDCTPLLRTLKIKTTSRRILRPGLL